MVIGIRSKIYLKALKQAKINGQLMREFIAKEVWTEAARSIDDELASLEDQKAVLNRIKNSIEGLR